MILTLTWPPDRILLFVDPKILMSNVHVCVGVVRGS